MHGVRWFGAVTLVIAALSSSRASADAVTCRKVETTFFPAPNLQIAVWVEDEAGQYVDTVYVTRLTGTLGLANRPGNGFFKSDFRFPYGRREMVLPVWAHKRDKRYGRVMMGGKFGNSKETCMASGISASECDDATIGYHFMVSSPEPFFCSPRGGVKTKVGGDSAPDSSSPRAWGSLGSTALRASSFASHASRARAPLAPSSAGQTEDASRRSLDQASKTSWASRGVRAAGGFAKAEADSSSTPAGGPGVSTERIGPSMRSNSSRQAAVRSSHSRRRVTNSHAAPRHFD